MIFTSRTWNKMDTSFVTFVGISMLFISQKIDK